MRIPWNIVTKNLSPSDARIPLEKKLQTEVGQFYGVRPFPGGRGPFADRAGEESP